MSSPGITFDGVWKKFRRGEVHDSLRDLIPALVKRSLRSAATPALGAKEFWAVRDVSFAVGPGEALGIIGPNGAGKSTILKLLTRILKPTLGSIEVRGRIGSLIEVAAGFHPDLTGRENVFLQGSIMGMRKAEIAARFDEIVAFAAIEEFIDTPVKRYSSGMNARLGFSIAAHMNPDVLIIDEVLAVGDFRFQKRAFDHIASLCESGIPVVIVSHQLDRVASLCNKAILLDHGTVAQRGTPAECIESYTANQSTAREDQFAGSPFRAESMVLLSPDRLHSGERIRFRLEVAPNTASGVRDPEHTNIGVRVRSVSTGSMLFGIGTNRMGIELPFEEPFSLEGSLQLNVQPGVYVLESYIWDPKHGRELAKGPSCTVQVEGGTPFRGTVQMNPTLEVQGLPVASATEAGIA